MFIVFFNALGHKSTWMGINFISASSKVSWTLLWNMALLHLEVGAFWYMENLFSPLTHVFSVPGKLMEMLLQLCITAMKTQASQTLSYHNSSILWNSSDVQVFTTEVHLGGVLMETVSYTNSARILTWITFSLFLYYFTPLFATSKWKVDMKCSCSTSGKIIYSLYRGRLQMAKQQII